MKYKIISIVRIRRNALAKIIRKKYILKDAKKKCCKHLEIQFQEH
jgi:hypothetical protein